MSYLERMTESQRELRRAAFRYNRDIKNWDPGKRERHRLRRALHELLNNVDYPAYTVRTDGEKIFVAPKDAITPEARVFMRTYRNELIVWLQEWSNDQLA